MGKHNLLRAEERVHPDVVWEDLKKDSEEAGSGVGYELLQGGDRVVIDLNAVPALSPFISEGGVYQRLRAIFTPPTKEDLRHYGLVEVYAGQGKRNQKRLMLTEIVPEGHDARVARVLEPDKDAVAAERTWRSTIKLSPDARYVAVEHEGNGATEVVGATDATFSEQHAIPAEMWAPPFDEARNACFPAGPHR